MISIYVTHPSQQVADDIVNVLLEKHLIACANFFPITSRYWWEGKIAETVEIVSLLKMTDQNWELVRDYILSVHPYTTPCIMRYELTANDGYDHWVVDESRGM